MQIARNLLRWSILLGLIATALIFLNGAIFRAWVAGGPPTPNPNGWLYAAGNYFLWSLASLLGAVGLFLLLGGRRPISRVAVAACVLAAVLLLIPAVREYLATDSCLDAGGQWSKAELRCLQG